MREHPKNIIHDLTDHLHEASVSLTEVRTTELTINQINDLLFELHEAYSSVVDELRVFADEANFMEDDTDDEETTQLYELEDDEELERTDLDNWDEQDLTNNYESWRSTKPTKFRMSDTSLPIDMGPVEPDELEEVDHDVRILDL